ncbi:MAG: DUF4215 domain-containing protein [Candidatus Peribacteria bacterium]|nr:MAG: DUF4215 domain-containing protein [Candidatus Peribacteria bacterium]
MCGDGTVDPGEQCGEPGLSCGATGDNCVACACEAGECGDGLTGANEECDDGNSDPLDGCTNTCCVDTDLNGICDSDEGMCGDGIIDPGEECGEPGLSCGTTGDNCVACACEPGTCGDGFTGVNEECDDGNLNPLDGCTDTCCVDVDLDGICDSDTEFTKTASLYDHTITYHINGYIPASGGAQTITLVDLLS